MIYMFVFLNISYSIFLIKNNEQIAKVTAKFQKQLYNPNKILITRQGKKEEVIFVCQPVFLKKNVNFYVHLISPRGIF